jgi:hypothetical protein
VVASFWLPLVLVASKREPTALEKLPALLHVAGTHVQLHQRNAVNRMAPFERDGFPTNTTGILAHLAPKNILEQSVLDCIRLNSNVAELELLKKPATQQLKDANWLSRARGNIRKRLKRKSSMQSFGSSTSSTPSQCSDGECPVTKALSELKQLFLSCGERLSRIVVFTMLGSSQQSSRKLQRDLCRAIVLLNVLLSVPSGKLKHGMHSSVPGSEGGFLPHLPRLMSNH